MGNHADVAIFDRIRRARAGGVPVAGADVQEVPEHLLPEINQRVSIAAGVQSPVPSRVEDRGRNALQLAMPALELEFGDPVSLTWDGENSWIRFQTRVIGIDSNASVPTILVATEGVISRYDERRSDARRKVELPIELRIVSARSVLAGRELRTVTSEVGSDAIRFETTATFSPGDLVEARIRIGDGTADTVGTRLRVVRVDTHADTWRADCTATFDEILRSDRARLLAAADTIGVIATEPMQPPAVSEPTTLDGVGGRDEPRTLTDLQHVIDYLERTDPARGEVDPR